jgi:uncharacterized protein (DUF983 family)
MILPDFTLVKTALRCKCPHCGKGDLYPGRWTLTVSPVCTSCGFPVGKNDSADGPAVFLIFILGAFLVPLALWLDSVFAPPLWFHAVLWTCVTLALTLLALRPLKAYVIALQHKYRPSDWS